MIFTSKKDETIKAKIVKEEEKYGTVLMEYLEGGEKGKTFSITKSTLKRWWKEEKSFVDTIDFEQVNEPYPEPKVKKYIPKPESVIEYEQKKKNRGNNDLPDFNKIVDELGQNCIKVNERSGYIMFSDKSTLWRKSGCIDIYATESLWTALTEVGFTSSLNKDKARPFAIKIVNADEYGKAVSVLSHV